MKKLLVGVALSTAAAALAFPVSAADLSGAHVGTSCPEGQTGRWHFVNNQTGGAGAGTLTAVFDGGAVVAVVGASRVNQNTQHFNVTGGNTLTGASTDLPGKLVLSDFSCEGHKKGDDGGKK